MKWKIGWGMSKLCNMNCNFCYSKETRKASGYEQNVEKGLQFILKNKDKIDSINWGTGEPAIAPGFFDCCEIIKKEAPHILLGITTNGTIYEKVKQNSRYLEIFEKCIDDVDISLDYANKNKQDESRGYEGAYELAVKTLELCEKYKKNKSIVNALHKYNCSLEEVDNLMRIARIYNASLRINIYRPTDGFDYALEYDELKKILIHLVHTYEIESMADALFASLFGVECPAGDPVGKSSFRILPNGYISPSTYLLDEDWFTIRIDQIDDIDHLKKTAVFNRILKADLPSFCSECLYSKQCRGGIIDRRWLWYHDLNQCDPYCPFRNDDKENWLLKSGEPILTEEKKSFVHDGYLPTLIFSPRINKRVLNKWDKIYLHDLNQYNDSEPEDFIKDSKIQGTVLDLGSGTGRNSMFLLKSGCDVVLVDDSKIANDIVCKKFHKEGIFKGYKIIDNTAEDFLNKNKDSKYDNIIAMHIISHGDLDSIKNTYISKFKEYLNDSGNLFITLPSTSDYRCSGDNDEVMTITLSDGPEKGIPHTFFSESGAVKLLEDYEIINMKLVTNEKGNAHWYICAK